MGARKGIYTAYSLHVSLPRSPLQDPRKNQSTTMSMCSQSKNHSQCSGVEFTNDHKTPPATLLSAASVCAPTEPHSSAPSINIVSILKPHSASFRAPLEDSAFSLYHPSVNFTEKDPERSSPGDFDDPVESNRIRVMTGDYAEYMRAKDVSRTVEQQRNAYRSQRNSVAVCDRAERNAKLNETIAKRRFDASYNLTLQTCRVSKINDGFERVRPYIMTLDYKNYTYRGGIEAEADLYYDSAEAWEKARREAQSKQFRERPKWRAPSGTSRV
jgi:hypothetical protein